MKHFFNTLSLLYNNSTNGYRVKYYCQAESFSYEIYSDEEAFVGKPAFRSEVYYFWAQNKEEILRDIIYNLNQLKI